MAKNPERSIEERTDLFVAQYQSKYSEAMSKARDAAETTATPAWRLRFGECMKAHKEMIAQKVRNITSSLEVMRTQDTSEDTEKDIRDSVKAIAEERIRHTAWWNRAVLPYREAAELPSKLAYGCIEAAGRAEEGAPLVGRGLAEEVRKRVQTWPKVKWDNESGCVVVTEKPEADDNTKAEAA